MKHYARELRRNQTDAERLLWYHLRNRRIAGYKFRRQEPIKSYIVDFVCFEAKLIIEVDGGQHLNQRDYDEGRTDCLTACGFNVVRFWNHDVLNDIEVVLECLYGHLNTQATPIVE